MDAQKRILMRQRQNRGLLDVELNSALGCQENLCHFPLLTTGIIARRTHEAPEILFLSQVRNRKLRKLSDIPLFHSSP